ncbi:MAG: hypothetical protein R3F60_02110 [bacterium]
MQSDEPRGLMALDAAGRRLMEQKGSAAYRLSVDAQDAALALIDALIERLRVLGMDASAVEARTGLSATTIEDGLESGDLSLAAFAIIARAVDLELTLKSVPCAILRGQWGAPMAGPAPATWAGDEVGDDGGAEPIAV